MPFEQRLEEGERVSQEPVCKKNIPGRRQQIEGHQGQTCQAHLKNTEYKWAGGKQMRGAVVAVRDIMSGQIKQGFIDYKDFGFCSE